MQGRIPEAFWYCFPVVWQETCVSRRQSSAEDLKSILQLTSSPLAVLPGCIACTRTQKEPLSATAPFCSSLRVISPCVGNSRRLICLCNITSLIAFTQDKTIQSLWILILAHQGVKPGSNPCGPVECWEPYSPLPIGQVCQASISREGLEYHQL